MKSSSFTSVATGDLEREGNDLGLSCQDGGEVETDGNRLAVEAFGAAVDASGVQRKVLASECRVSEGHFSKVSSGQQGSVFDLAYRLPAKHASIRADFFSRLVEQESVDPVTHAAEQAVIAAMRLIRVCQRGTARMAKAAIQIERRSVAR